MFGRSPLPLAALCSLSLLVVPEAHACTTTCTLLGSGERSGPTGSAGYDLGPQFVMGGSYDLPKGALAGSSTCSCSGSQQLVVARDAFQLHSPGTSGPIHVDVEVQFDVTIQGPGAMKLPLRS